MKIDYSKIDWNAKTNWGFCGTKENLRTVWERNWDCFGVRVPIEEFAYQKPRRGLAFAKGDVVTYTAPGESSRYASVVEPVNKNNGYTYIRLADGVHVAVHPGTVPTFLAVADVPDELLALARAEAGKSVDFSKRPLKKPACTEA